MNGALKINFTAIASNFQQRLTIGGEILIFRLATGGCQAIASRSLGLWDWSLSDSVDTANFSQLSLDTSVDQVFSVVWLTQTLTTVSTYTVHSNPDMHKKS